MVAWSMQSVYVGISDSMRILIVEDSKRLRHSLTEGLTRCGYGVDALANGLEGLRYAMHTEYDVIVLDLGLPDIDGLEVLSQLRQAGRRSAVLILSARDRVQDRIDGLHAGADDYLIKPFAFDELLARVGVLVRRRHDERSPTLAIANAILNTSLHRVTVNDQELPLTPLEVSILELLALNRGRTLSQTVIEDRLYGAGTQVNRNTIEVHISKLRKKLRSAGVNDVIRTRRGFGYCLDEA